MARNPAGSIVSRDIHVRAGNFPISGLQSIIKSGVISVLKEHPYLQNKDRLLPISFIVLNIIEMASDFINNN